MKEQKDGWNTQREPRRIGDPRSHKTWCSATPCCQLAVHLSICLSVCLSVICLFIYLSISRISGCSSLLLLLSVFLIVDLIYHQLLLIAPSPSQCHLFMVAKVVQICSQPTTSQGHPANLVWILRVSSKTCGGVTLELQNGLTCPLSKGCATLLFNWMGQRTSACRNIRTCLWEIPQ